MSVWFLSYADCNRQVKTMATKVLHMIQNKIHGNGFRSHFYKVIPNLRIIASFHVRSGDGTQVCCFKNVGFLGGFGF